MRRGIVVYKIIQVYCIPDEGGLQGFVRGYSRLATYTASRQSESGMTASAGLRL